MCGIGGIFQLGDPPHPPLPLAWRAAMMDKLRQRGPDGQVVQGFNALLQAEPTEASTHHAFLHARLAIIDPKPHAAQPMMSHDGRFWLVFNGEIYNWRALRQQLADDYPFRTQSDSEVILAGAQVWGFEKTLAALQGMFAFALLAVSSQQLYLARDRLGKKPLLYHFSKRGGDQARGLFGFASMVNALLPLESAFPPTQQGIDPLGIDAFLAHRTVLPPHTVHRGINRLAPAHAIEVNLRHATMRTYRYWRPTASFAANMNIAELQDSFQRSVATRLSSDRPVGIFLSGGVDSAVVAHAIPKAARPNILALTAQFDVAAWDETDSAATTAKELGFTHLPVPIRPNLRDDFSRIVADFDDPFADPSALPTWYLAREATRHVKVVLSGDGGDEFFGGYKRYPQHLRWENLAKILGAGLMHAPRKGHSRLTDFQAALFPSPWQRTCLEATWRHQAPLAAYALRFSGLAPWQRLALYQQDAAASMPSVYWQNGLHPEALSFPHRSAAETLMAVDAENYLPEYILRKGDLATMAYGLEMRQPILDHLLIEHILQLPLNVRLEKPPKWALIQSLPNAMQQRLMHAKKRGFNPPLRHWLTNDLAERLPELGKRLNKHCPWINAQAVQKCVHALMSPQNAQEQAWSGKMAERVYQLLVLDEHLMALK